MDGECRSKNCLIGRRGNDVQHKKRKEKLIRIWITIILRRFELLGSRVMALSIKCDSLTLRTESREECQCESGQNETERFQKE